MNVYSCGCLLYYLCTGGAPVQGRDLRSSRARTWRQAAAAVEINPQISAALDEVILHALAFIPRSASRAVRAGRALARATGAQRFWRPRARAACTDEPACRAIGARRGTRASTERIRRRGAPARATRLRRPRPAAARDPLRRTPAERPSAPLGSFSGPLPLASPPQSIPAPPPKPRRTRGAARASPDHDAARAPGRGRARSARSDRPAARSGRGRGERRTAIIAERPPALECAGRPARRRCSRSCVAGYFSLRAPAAPAAAEQPQLRGRAVARLRRARERAGRRTRAVDARATRQRRRPVPRLTPGTRSQPCMRRAEQGPARGLAQRRCRAGAAAGGAPRARGSRRRPRAALGRAPAPAAAEPGRSDCRRATSRSESAREAATARTTNADRAVASHEAPRSPARAPAAASPVNDIRWAPLPSTPRGTDAAPHRAALACTARSAFFRRARARSQRGPRSASSRCTARSRLPRCGARSRASRRSSPLATRARRARPGATASWLAVEVDIDERGRAHAPRARGGALPASSLRRRRGGAIQARRPTRAPSRPPGRWSSRREHPALSFCPRAQRCCCSADA